MTDHTHDSGSAANRDCLAKARPGEPMFILLGRDPDAHTIVTEWAARRVQAAIVAGTDPTHGASAMPIAEAMRLYAADPANAPASAPPADAYPPSPAEQAIALQDTADQLVLAKLVSRFFRVLILGGVVIPETPAAMDWLRDYIDGTHKVHGPLGKPMIWPGRLPTICQLLRDWGFQPTPTNPQYVALRPGGVVADLQMPEPLVPVDAPDTERHNQLVPALLQQLVQGTGGKAQCLVALESLILGVMLYHAPERRAAAEYLDSLTVRVVERMGEKA